MSEDTPRGAGCLGLLLLLLLFGCAVMGPAVLAARYGPAIGLVSALTALGAWVRWGPPGVLGLVPGLLLMSVLFADLSVAAMCLGTLIGLDPGGPPGCAQRDLPGER